MGSLTDEVFTGNYKDSERDYFKDELIPQFNESFSGDYKKDGDKYYIVVEPVKAYGNEQIKSLFPDESKAIFYHSFGLIASEKDITKDFDSMVDDVKVFIGAMYGVYFFLIILVLVGAYFLIHYVVKKFVQPLQTLITSLQCINSENFQEASDMLLKEPLKYKEFNRLKDFLPKFCTLYQFCKKEFFETQNLDVLILNYSQALDLFMKEKNYIGAAICYNNLGNAYCKKAAQPYEENEDGQKSFLAQNDCWNFAQESYKKAIEQIELFKHSLSQYNEFVESQMEGQDKQEYQSLIEQFGEFLETEDTINRNLQMALANLQRLDTLSTSVSQKNQKSIKKQEWIELIQIFELVLTQDIQNKKHLERVIWILLHISLCYQMLRDLTMSAKCLTEAEKWLKMLEEKNIKIDVKRLTQLNQILLSKMNEELVLEKVMKSQEKAREEQEENMFTVEQKFEIKEDFIGSSDILRQRLMLYRALLFKDQGRLLESAQLLTLLIQIGERYDPSIRLRALQELKGIFQEQQLEAPGLKFLLDQHSSNKGRDFVFVICTNGFMKNDEERIKSSLSYFTKNLSSNNSKQMDQVALLTYSNRFELKFNLLVDESDQLANNLFFDNQQDQTSWLFDSISEGIKILQKTDQRKKYIFVITSQEDKGSKIQRENLSQDLKFNEVMLIAIAVRNNLPYVEALINGNDSHPGLYMQAQDGTYMNGCIDEICGVLGIYKPSDDS